MKNDDSLCRIKVIPHNCGNCIMDGSVLLVAEYLNKEIVPIAYIRHGDEDASVLVPVENVMRAKLLMPDTSIDNIISMHSTGMLDDILKIEQEERDV